MKVCGLTGGVLCVLLCFGLKLCSAITTPCALRAAPYGSVCVCNTTYCDYLDPVHPDGADEFVIISSSRGGLRFSTESGKFSDGSVVVTDPVGVHLSEMNPYGPMVVLVYGDETLAKYPTQGTLAKRTVTIKVDRNKEFQKILGFGGAFTGAVSHILDQTPTEIQDAIYKSYYSQEGIGFNMMRMSIGGCDFDLEPWAYNELPENDTEISNFTKLDARDERKIEQIERLKSIANIDDIKIMAAAWSPPKWMKTNNAWSGFSMLKKQYYQTWALYHLKFLELMDAKNTPIWAISTGNEPLNGIIGWIFVHFMSLGWSPQKQAVWLAEHLGPTIRSSRFKDVKIFSNDDQRYTFPTWFKVMKLMRRNSVDYLDGLAVHWYWDEFIGTSTIDKAHAMFEDKLLINTETSVGDKPFSTHGPELGSWERGEKYAHSYMQDLQHHFNGYIDWNLILDERGGPNYVDNFVDSAVIVNVTSGEEFYKNPIFYSIGHFSKFIPEGSIRVEAARTNVNVATVALKRPDGSIAVVFLNTGKASVDATLVDSVRGNIVISIPPRSLHTIVYN